jgi:methylmalonyl-CoA/ethylmalonyl-CoA epimerase
MPDGRRISLHHVGFVVNSIGLAAEGFLRSLNASWDRQIFEDTRQRVRVTFLTTLRSEPQIELVEPMGDRSPVSRFLLEKGGGLHHFCYETDDLGAELKEFRARGSILARPPVPAVAFGGRRIAWLLTPEHLLLELLERTPVSPVASKERS